MCCHLFFLKKFVVWSASRADCQLLAGRIPAPLSSASSVNFGRELSQKSARMKWLNFSFKTSSPALVSFTRGGGLHRGNRHYRLLSDALQGAQRPRPAEKLPSSNPVMKHTLHMLKCTFLIHVSPANHSSNKTLQRTRSALSPRPLLTSNKGADGEKCERKGGGEGNYKFKNRIQQQSLPNVRGKAATASE